MATNPARQLEQLLQLWEDACFTLANCQRAHDAAGQVPTKQAPLVGPFLHALEFRDYLLTAKAGDRETDGFERFEGEDHDWAEIIKVIGPLWSVPLSLRAWITASRRVYSLTEELQALLGVTSVRDLFWNDIRWPFDSFAVRLATPLPDRYGILHDTVLVDIENADYSGPHGTYWLRIMLLPQGLESYNGMRSFERDHIRDLMRRRQWLKAAKACDRIYQRMDEAIFPSPFGMPVLSTVPILVTEPFVSAYQISARHTDELRDGSGIPEEPLRDTVSRILVGLVLYLQTLPPGDAHSSAWNRPLESIPDPKAICAGAEVCLVKSRHRLSAEELAAFRSTQLTHTGLERCAHFRCGHWRRPPGRGHIPEATKTVHVRPTLVRRDRLRPGEIPGGAESILEK